MEKHDAEQLTGLLQATLIAVSALLATHPQPDRLRKAFDALQARSPHGHLAYLKTLDTLRKSIP